MDPKLTVVYVDHNSEDNCTSIEKLQLILNINIINIKYYILLKCQFLHQSPFKLIIMKISKDAVLNSYSHCLSKIFANTRRF